VLLALLLMPLLIGAAEPERWPSRSTPNNIVGLNLARLHQPRYVWAAADVVNANGGAWGYVTVLLTNADRDDDLADFQLQQLLDRCFESKLQPIVRVGTRFDANTGDWDRPTLDDPSLWRMLFERVRWPNRTVWIVPANEPNLGREWGGRVDVVSYARYLEHFLDVFADSDRFRVVNGPLNLSNESKLPEMEDAFEFLGDLEATSPGLMARLPAWASNAYQVNGLGPGLRYTHRGYQAELDAIGRDMPVLITETGVFRSRNQDDEARFFSQAYRDWQADPRVIAATPLLWDPDLDDHWLFSFAADGTVVGSSATYQRLRELPRVAGSPNVLPPLPNTARETAAAPFSPAPAFLPEPLPAPDMGAAATAGS
jgi:hypothetical protein